MDWSNSLAFSSFKVLVIAPGAPFAAVIAAFVRMNCCFETCKTGETGVAERFLTAECCSLLECSPRNMRVYMLS